MRDRYSILVGLLFLAIDRRSPRSTRSSGGGDEDTLGLDKPASPLAAARVRRAAAPPARSKATPTSPRTTAKRSPSPCPQSARREPACRISHGRRDPRLRPLRPAAGDLVLVHQGRRLRRTAGRGRARLPALPWAGELPLARHPRRSRHGARTDPPARLDDAGRLRPRRRRRRPLPGRRLPDLRLRLPRRHPARAPASANSPRRQLAARVASLLRATGAAEGELR